MDITDQLTKTWNARALRDLPLHGGGTLASRVLYRSDSLAGLTTEGVAALGHYGIGTVIDLRTHSERETAADVLPQDGSVRLIELPVLGGDMASMAKTLVPAAGGPVLDETQLAELMAKIPTLEELYVGILSGASAQFATLGRAVIEAAETDVPGVLIHCTAGKDRTGVASALLLSLAGVTHEAIVADYSLTGANLARGFSEQLLGMISQYGIPVTPALRTLATESPAPAIEAALGWVAEKHGDAGSYFEAGGMTPSEVATLRQLIR